MTDLFVIALVVLIVGLAVWYIRRSKAKGVACVGCPEAKNCASRGSCSCCSGCGDSCRGKTN